MSRKFLFVLFTFIILSIRTLQGQDVLNDFRHISTSDGFSLNPVNSIGQDKKGMIWFGTRNGLMRYDGNELKVMRREIGVANALRTNDIYSIFIDSVRGVWMGSKNGLSIYDQRVNSSIDYPWNDPQSQQGTSSSNVYDVLRCSDKEVWVATRSGLNVFNELNQTVTYYFHDPNDSTTLSSNFVTNIFKASDGTIWVGTRNGLNKVLSKVDDKIEFKSYHFDRLLNGDNSLNSISCIEEDHKGNIWVGTGGGLVYFDVNKEEAKRFGTEYGQDLTNDLIQDITIDTKNRLWVGTFNGLNIIDSAHNLVGTIRHDPRVPNSLSGNSIRSLFTDRDGGIWIATYYGGVNYWNEKQFNFERIQESNGTQLSYSVVSSIVEGEDGKIIVGTEGAGLSIMDSSTNHFTYINQLTPKSFVGTVKGLLYVEGNQLWIATFNNGLIHLDLNTRKFKDYRGGSDSIGSNVLSSDQIISLSYAPDGRIWLGTLNQGLDLFDPKQNKVINFNASFDRPDILSNNVRALLLNSEGDLFVGTGSGISVLKKDTFLNSQFKFKFLDYENEAVDFFSVNDIFEDSSGRIWFGVQEFGLFYIERDLVYSTGLNGISSVFGITEDDTGLLWLSSEEGVVSYNPITGKQRIYNRNDGVHPNEYNKAAKLTSADGRVYFGGASGVTSFYPHNLNEVNDTAPKVVITGLSLLGNQVIVGDTTGILKHSIEYTDKITLDYDQNIFSVHFAMPNYINSDKNTYLYRLIGLDDNWVKTTNPSVSFTIQRGGEYVFEVKGINSDGKESEVSTNLVLVMNSAPWRTGWAYLFYSSVILTAMIVFIFFYRSRLRLQHQLEMESQALIKQEELNQQKFQFFTNISHEFRTPLTLISGYLEKLMTDYKGPSSIFRQLNVIRKNTDHLFKLINELMDFRKLENKQMKLQAGEEDIVRFTHEIFLSFTQQAASDNLKYTFHSQDMEILVYFDRDKLEKVLYNLISNAFKYTPPNGEIEVIIAKSEEKVYISIKDSGIGIADEHLDKIFDRFYEIAHQKRQAKYKHGSGIGLAIAQNIVLLHKGNLSVDSKEGLGSTFTMELSLGREHLLDDEIVCNLKNSEDFSHYLSKSPIVNTLEINPEVENPDKDVKILVVEDNVEIGEFIKDILSKDYNVALEPNGGHGYQKALSFQPDLIISDVMMPIMDGIEFCSKIKGDIRTSHIPFVLLTARTSTVFKYSGLESGADEYLSKPFEVKELILKCKNIINTQRKLKDKIAESGEFTPSEVMIANSRDEEMMNKAIRLIKENIANEFFDIQYLCEELGISKSLLFAKFKAWTNKTPNEFSLAMKMKRAADILEQNKTNVSEICYQVGFKNPNYFSKVFKKHFGVSPKDYAEKFTENLGID